LEGRPFVGVEAKSWSDFFDILSNPLLEGFNFSGSCSAIAIAACWDFDTLGIIHLDNFIIS
jgi:hypothetical protein